VSELFPELPREVAAHLLRDGLRIQGEDSESKKALDCLCNLNVVTVREHAYVRCAYRDDYDYLDRERLKCDGRVEISDGEDEYYCPECGQPIGDVEKKTHFMEWEVMLQPEGIHTYIVEAILALDKMKAVEETGLGSLRIESRTGDSLKVVLPEYAGVREQSAGLFFAEPTLYVVASTTHDPVKTSLEDTQYVGLWEILSETPEKFEERVLGAAVPIQGRREFSKVEDKFESMLERHKARRWQFFEHDFLPAFVQYVGENPELCQLYLDKLKRLRSTIFGRFSVRIGGSGVTDLRQIDKYEMVSELFEGEFIGDAKCYVDSILNYSDLTSVVTHLDTDPTRPKRAVVFVAGDDISSTSWDLMMRLRHSSGYWRLVIVSKYLLLEMISELEAGHLLEM
jgi:hypothetical protein